MSNDRHQMDLFDLKRCLRGHMSVKLRDFVDLESFSSERITLFQRMQFAHHHMNSLMENGEHRVVNRLRTVFKRLCWPGALKILPRHIYESHIQSLTDRARTSAPMQPMTDEEMLWTLALYAEQAPINETAVALLKEKACSVLGERVVDMTEDMIPLTTERDTSNLITVFDTVWSGVQS